VGLIYALAAYLSWGLVVPVHFRLLDGIPPGTILAQRIVWSALLVTGLIALLRKRLANPFPLRPRHAGLLVSAGLIAINWMLYLVAV
jgi:chloramphenicol-sensitive protein RarD